MSRDDELDLAFALDLDPNVSRIYALHASTVWDFLVELESASQRELVRVHAVLVRALGPARAARVRLLVPTMVLPSGTRRIEPLSDALRPIAQRRAMERRARVDREARERFEWLLAETITFARMADANAPLETRFRTLETTLPKTVDERLYAIAMVSARRAAKLREAGMYPSEPMREAPSGRIVLATDDVLPCDLWIASRGTQIAVFVPPEMIDVVERAVTNGAGSLHWAVNSW